MKPGDEAREALIRQVSMPVRWEESIRELIEEGVNTFVEVGPGRVLTGLLRQIERSVAALNVEDEKAWRRRSTKSPGAQPTRPRYEVSLAQTFVDALRYDGKEHSAHLATGSVSKCSA